VNACQLIVCLVACGLSAACVHAPKDDRTRACDQINTQLRAKVAILDSKPPAALFLLLPLALPLVIHDMRVRADEQAAAQYAASELLLAANQLGCRVQVNRDERSGIEFSETIALAGRRFSCMIPSGGPVRAAVAATPGDPAGRYARDRIIFPVGPVIYVSPDVLAEPPRVQWFLYQAACERHKLGLRASPKAGRHVTADCMALKYLRQTGALDVVSVRWLVEAFIGPFDPAYKDQVRECAASAGVLSDEGPRGPS
jgi:hypothetical protein